MKRYEVDAKIKVLMRENLKTGSGILMKFVAIPHPNTGGQSICMGWLQIRKLLEVEHIYNFDCTLLLCLPFMDLDALWYRLWNSVQYEPKERRSFDNHREV